MKEFVIDEGIDYVRSGQNWQAAGEGTMHFSRLDRISPVVPVPFDTAIACSRALDLIGSDFDSTSFYANELISDCRPNAELKSTVKQMKALRRSARSRYRRELLAWQAAYKAYKAYARDYLRKHTPRYQILSRFEVNFTTERSTIKGTFTRQGLNTPADLRFADRGWSRIVIDQLPARSERKFRSTQTVQGRFWNWLVANPAARFRFWDTLAGIVGTLPIGETPYVRVHEFQVLRTDDKRSRKGRYRRSDYNALRALWLGDNPKPSASMTPSELKEYDRLRRAYGNAIMYHTCCHLSDRRALPINRDYAELASLPTQVRGSTWAPADMLGSLSPVATHYYVYRWREYHEAEVTDLYHPFAVGAGGEFLNVPYLLSQNLRSRQLRRPSWPDGSTRMQPITYDSNRSALPVDEQEVARMRSRLIEAYTLTKTAALVRDDFSLTRSIAELKDAPDSIKTIMELGSNSVRYRGRYGKWFDKICRVIPGSKTIQVTAGMVFALDLAVKWGIEPTVKDVQVVAQQGLAWTTQYYRALRELYARIGEAVYALTLKKRVATYPAHKGATVHREEMLLDLTKLAWESRREYPTITWSVPPYDLGTDIETVRRDAFTYQFNNGRDATPFVHSLFSSDFPVGLPPDYLSVPIDGQYVAPASLLVTSANERYSLFCRLKASRLRELITREQTVLEGLASAQMLKTTWDLIPLSFVVDWFTNVGRSIALVERELTAVLMGVEPTDESPYVWLNQHWDTLVGEVPLLATVPNGSLEILTSETNASRRSKSDVVSVSRRVPKGIRETIQIEPLAEAILALSHSTYTRRPVVLAGGGVPLLNIRLDLGKLVSLLELANGFLNH